MNIIWKDIKGYEGIYQVSNRGDVRSLKFNKIKLLSKGRSQYGYVSHFLCKNGKIRGKRRSRLVAIAFIDNPHKKPQVNHIDGNKQNDAVENLEWSTASENIQHAFDTGLNFSRNRGESNYNHKLNSFQVQRMRLMKQIDPKLKFVKIAKMFNITPQHTGTIIRREKWCHS